MLEIFIDAWVWFHRLAPMAQYEVIMIGVLVILAVGAFVSSEAGRR